MIPALCGFFTGSLAAPGPSPLSTSILDLRYESEKFLDKTVMLHGYFSDKASNDLWIYISSEAAQRQSKHYGIQLVAATDEIEELRRGCGAGYAFVVGHFTVPESSGIGLILVEKIVMHDAGPSTDAISCWERLSE